MKGKRMNNNYYLNQKKKIMKKFKRVIKNNLYLLETYYGKSEASIIVKEIES